MLLAFWEDVSEQPKGMFAQVKRPEVASLVFSQVEVVQGLLTRNALCAPRLLTQGGESAQWESRKGRALPVHPIAEAQLLEGIVYWSRVSSKR